MSALPACFRIVRGWRPLDLHTVASAFAWEQPTIRMFGKPIAVPRLTAWQGVAAYSYSGHRHEPVTVSQLACGLVADLHATTGVRFDSVLANHYRDGSDSVSWHADDEPELGVDPVIASLSLGAARTFAVRHVHTGESWRVQLGGGDLLVMSGEAQREYQHAVPKSTRAIGPRINLSFRVLTK